MYGVSTGAIADKSSPGIVDLREAMKDKKKIECCGWMDEEMEERERERPGKETNLFNCLQFRP